MRYDELKRGEIEHALRFTIVKTSPGIRLPATHFASRDRQESAANGRALPLACGFRHFRLLPPKQTILKALKKYGMFVADNGIDWAISLRPDPRIPELSDQLRKVKGSDFEVVTPVP